MIGTHENKSFESRVPNRLICKKCKMKEMDDIDASSFVEEESKEKHSVQKIAFARNHITSTSNYVEITH